MSAKRLLATDLDGTFIGDDRAMLRLWDALDQRGTLVAFSTGRHLKSIEDFYAGLSANRRADVCICMVGTDIYFRRNGEYELDTAWHDIISEDWDKKTVEKIIRVIPEARMQDAEWQSPFKSSYYLEECVEENLGKIHEQLERARVRAKVVYSAGKFLDLLPARSGKGEAVRFVRSELGFRSIAVGNAAEELKAFRAPHVYHARASFAAGIQEGLEVHGWL